MRNAMLLAAGCLLALLTSCGGRPNGSDADGRVTLEALYGTSVAGVQLVQEDYLVRLTFNNLPPSGKMLRLRLPADQTIDQQSWTGSAQTIQLIAPVAKGAEIGIVPLKDYSGEPVSVELTLIPGTRTVSAAPLGQANVIHDLSVTAIDVGQVQLSWTQMNSGDYDFNGQVNISDLTPLAPRIGDSIDREAVGADLQTAFWVDGDANGEINISDITPIGAHYSSHVYGYNIKRNGSKLEGAGPGEPTLVSSTSAEKRTGLPNRYSSIQTGLTSDIWVVTPVDGAGNEGADSNGDPGSAPVDLQTTLNIIGLDLRDLATGAVGGFGEGKFSTRVIDPIDVVNRAQIGTVALTPSGSQISNLPRGRVFMVDFRFAPTVDLTTGAPRGASKVKRTSAVPESEIVNAAVIFELPEGTEPGQIENEITAEPNPDGGYFLNMQATITMPGDNPDTAAVEPGFTVTQRTQIDFANGTVARDTNGDGFDDNPHVEDSDRDGVGENERERFKEWEDGDRGEAEEIGIVATVKSLDFAAGTITLSVSGNNGEHEVLYPGPFNVDTVFPVTELTEFVVRTDAGETYGWHQFNLGDVVEVDMYRALSGNGYWLEKVKRDDREDD